MSKRRTVIGKRGRYGVPDRGERRLHEGEDRGVEAIGAAHQHGVRDAGALSGVDARLREPESGGRAGVVACGARALRGPRARRPSRFAGGERWAAGRDRRHAAPGPRERTTGSALAHVPRTRGRVVDQPAAVRPRTPTPPRGSRSGAGASRSSRCSGSTANWCSSPGSGCGCGCDLSPDRRSAATWPRFRSRTSAPPCTSPTDWSRAACPGCLRSISRSSTPRTGRSAASGWRTYPSPSETLPQLPHATSRAVMAVALCAALVSPVFAGEWSATAGWGIRLDQHRVIPGTPGEPPARVAPWTQLLLPTLRLAGEPLGARIGVAASGRLELGASVTGEGQGPLRRGSAGEVSTSVARTFGPGVRLMAAGSAARSRDLLDVDQATVSADGDALRMSGSASADSRSLEGRWHAHGWRSGSGPPSDTRSLEWGARAFLDRSPLAAAFLGGRERRLEHEREIQLLARTALLGVQRDVGPGLALTLELGAVQEQIGLEREQPRPAYGVELASPRGE